MNISRRLRGTGQVICVALGLTAWAQEQPTTAIKVDQVGYPTWGPKIALVGAPARTFLLKRASDGTTVFSGRLSRPRSDDESGEHVSAADFSKVRDAGAYYLEVPGVGRSWNFEIGPNVFARTYYLAMRAFYGQRCGVAVDLGPEFPGFTHPACHLNDAFDPSSGKQGPNKNAGGWHDAGDYGRYLPSSGITTGTLLWTWELFGTKLKSIGLHIPESGSGTPDLLSETRWNLEWMLTMQDADGGVWHKQTSVMFSGFVMPENDTAPSVVIGTGTQPFKSTCATADLAAVAAIAARVYKPYDAAFAARNLRAARSAWAWAERFPNVTFKNPAGIATGEYADTQCGDERLWAAAELWRTTGENAFQQFFLENYAQYLPTLDSPPREAWAQTAPMGLWTYLLEGRKNADPRVAKSIRERTLTAARRIATRTRGAGYRVSMTENDFVWGSNAVAANYGMELLIANILSPHAEFAEAALDHLHYLLGRNTFSLSWVTQVGANAVRHPHHRPSGADQNAEPWPGLLAGGPNKDRQDAVLKSLPDLPPAQLYRDNQDSYASNEIAINWQALLVFLLAGQLR